MVRFLALRWPWQTWMGVRYRRDTVSRLPDLVLRDLLDGHESVSVDAVHSPVWVP
jgi:hypothetical protein